MCLRPFVHSMPSKAAILSACWLSLPVFAPLPFDLLQVFHILRPSAAVSLFILVRFLLQLCAVLLDIGGQLQQFARRKEMRDSDAAPCLPILRAQDTIKVVL